MHAVTSTGTNVVLAHVCLDSYQMVVNWNEDDVVTFTQKTFDVLGGWPTGPKAASAHPHTPAFPATPMNPPRKERR